MSRIASAVAAACVAAGCSGIALAQTASWPTKPIRLLVGFPAGGPTDIVARIVGEKLASQVGQQVVVDNRPGASGNIAVEHLTRANPDGHTLVYSSNAIALSPGLYAKLGYDPLKDVAPVTEIGAGCLIFVIHPTTPVANVKEFIDYAKARPGQLNYGSSGAGTSTHLAAVLFSQRVGIQTQHIPYKGTAPSLADMIAGRTHFLMGAVLTAVPHVKDGRLRALGVTCLNRIKSLPQVPTIDEAGVPKFEVTTWQGIFAPAATPPAILDRVHAEMIKAIRSPDLRPRIEQQDMEPTGPTRANFSASYREQVARWTKVAREAGLQAM